MNNIHEDDWADETWSRHSGMPDISEIEAQNDEFDEAVMHLYNNTTFPDTGKIS